MTNNETGESSYEDPRTFGDDEDDMDEIKEEVEEEMTEDESSDEASEGEKSNTSRANRATMTMPKRSRNLNGT